MRHRAQERETMYTNLYIERTKRKVSQSELSEQSGVSQSQISKIEKGLTSSPAHDKLVRIAEALNCTIDDLRDEGETLETQPIFSSLTNSGAAVFIPLFNERQPMNQEFDKGDGFIVRQLSAAQTQIRKPSFLDYSAESYAATNYGAAMQPRYFSGDTLFVDPTLEAMPKDDVVVMFRLTDRMAGIFREFVSQTDDQIVIKDVASNKPVTLNRADIYALHVVVGSQRNRAGG